MAAIPYRQLNNKPVCPVNHTAMAPQHHRATNRKWVATSIKNCVFSEYWSSTTGVMGLTTESVERRLVLPADAGWISVTGEDKVVPVRSLATRCLKRNTVHRK